jgi:hypothetical protein
MVAGSYYELFLFCLCGERIIGKTIRFCHVLIVYAEYVYDSQHGSDVY